MHNPTSNERVFSVELTSVTNVKTLLMTNGKTKERILIEGTIGNLLQVSFTEGIILEVIGDKGILRIDLEKKETQ